ncbi:MAG: hypothetical protein HYV75_11570, partial [Opitutae bacterium]|nr:hypothetical protein [Opitutae bacterium]
EHFSPTQPPAHTGRPAAMHIHPLTVTVSAPRDPVFHFLADIENLPKWAGAWCGRLGLLRGRWWALTADGEQVLDMETSAGTGVIDLRAGPSPDRFRLTAIRVVALSPRRTLVSFLLVEGPDESDEAFARRRQLLHYAADALLKRFGGGELHRAPAGPHLAGLGLN